MVPIVQLVRASDCGSECRGFESHWAPFKSLGEIQGFFVYILSHKSLKKRNFLKKRKNVTKVSFRCAPGIHISDIFTGKLNRDETEGTELRRETEGEID